MKLEMIKKESLNEPTIHYVYLDGKFIACKVDYDEALEIYNKVKANPRLAALQPVESICLSEEI